MVMPASRWAPRPRLGVAGFPWNQWQLCYGISGNFRVEQVAALAWNRWQDSPGISGSFGVEYAVPLQESHAPGLGLFPRSPRLHHGGLQCAGPVAWLTAQLVGLRAPLDR